MAKTRGQYLVGTSFNPSKDSMVDKIKAKAADLIDTINSIPMDDMTPEHAGDVNRLRALAVTAIEEGAMWGVKAATKPPMDQ